jgi:Domain of unknown function (DUF4349)
MRRSVALILTVLTIALSACSYGSRSTSLRGEADVASSPATAVGTGGAGINAQDRDYVAVSAKRVGMAEEQAPRPGDRAQQQGNQEVPLDSAGAAQAFARKVIQNAEITIETDKPNEGQQKIGVIAEKHGGFVIISESKRNEAASQNVASTLVNVVVRVPAQKFQTTIDEIRAVGGRILHDKSWSEDVTEEYIDLDARIRTKRALEAQFLEIMKQARKISDAMEVQTQLADVRTEIERLEGRRRFLENQSALSTIKVTLHSPTPVVAAATRGFLYDLKAAFGDGADIGSGIFLGVIRFVIVMIPLTLFILLPAWFVFKWLRKRISWPVKAAAVSVTNPAE